MKRRSFLIGVGGAVGAGTLAAPSAGDTHQGETPAGQQAPAGLPRRTLGRTGAKISIVGFPGLALIHHEQKECDTGVRRAFDQGVNYFDVAPAYGKGDAEIKLGIGLQGIDRSKIFLSCKTKMRDKEGAREELERSLTRLKTDHFDLYQLHCLIQPDEVKQALGPGGAMETILKAKEEGKIKHIGFSAHTTKAALAALRGFRFDTVMFPINFVEYHTIGFGKPVLQLAKEQDAAVISIKPVSRGRWPKEMPRTRRWWYRPVEDPQEIGLAMRFTLGLPNVVTGIPVSFLDILDRVIQACRVDRPNTDAESQQLQQIAATCESVFQAEEERVASRRTSHMPLDPDCPHTCCSRNIA